MLSKRTNLCGGSSPEFAPSTRLELSTETRDTLARSLARMDEMIADLRPIPNDGLDESVANCERWAKELAS